MATPHSPPPPPNGYWHRSGGRGTQLSPTRTGGPGNDAGDYVSIGSVRVRLMPSTNKVAAAAQSGGDESDCCCGVPWPRSTPSRILLREANYSRAQFERTPVYRSTLQWTQSSSSSVVTGCFGKDNGVKFQLRHRPPAKSCVLPKPDIPAYFKFCRSASESSESQKLLSSVDLSVDGELSRVCTLDRLQKFRFGGERGGRGGKKGNNAHKKKPQRSSDKAERLRELTEKLKLPSSKQAASASTDSSSVVGKSECADKSTAVASASRVSSGSAVPVEDVFECVRINPPKPESRPLIGSYTQRTIPFRSASFSQMDYNQINGKYTRIPEPGATVGAVNRSQESVESEARCRGARNASDTADLLQPSSFESSVQTPQTPSKLSLIPQATARLLGRRFGSQSFESTSYEEPDLNKFDADSSKVNQAQSKDLPPQPPKRTKHRIHKVDHCTQTVSDETLGATKLKGPDISKSKIKPPNQLVKQSSLNSNLETLDTFLNELIGIKMEYEDKYKSRTENFNKKSRSIANINAISDDKFSELVKSKIGDSNNNVSCVSTNAKKISPINSCSNGKSSLNSINNFNSSNSSNSCNNDRDLSYSSSPGTAVESSLKYNLQDSNSNNTCECDERSGDLSRSESLEEERKLPTIVEQPTNIPKMDPSMSSESYVSRWPDDRKNDPSSSNPIINPTEVDVKVMSKKQMKHDNCDLKQENNSVTDSSDLVGNVSRANCCQSDESDENVNATFHSDSESAQNETVTNHVTVFVTNEKDENCDVNLLDFLEEPFKKGGDKNEELYPETLSSPSETLDSNNDSISKDNFEGASELDAGQNFINDTLSTESRNQDSWKLSKESSLESNSNLSELHSQKLESDAKEIPGSNRKNSDCDLNNLLNFETNFSGQEESKSAKLESWPSSTESDYSKRPKLVAQSSEERDDEGISLRSPKRFILARADSLSEGESDHVDRRPLTPASDRDSTASPCMLSICDLSDSENTPRKQSHNYHHHHHHHHHHHPPKMYEKRPLRGPYGQMLEAEMKKPENTRDKLTKLHSSEDLKFLIKECLKFPPSETNRFRTVDDCQLRRSHTSPPDQQPHRTQARLSPKRKVSANIPYSHPVSLAPSSADNGLQVHHQRTTSSPSQLEGCSSVSKPQPSPQLLAQLLKGSSEKVYNPLETNSILQSNTNQVQKDTRTHVVEELLETERSYVDSLQTLVNKYLKPLKEPENSVRLDPDLVDDIFFQVPEILNHHLVFLEKLENRVKLWNMKQKIIIGDILLETFSQLSVIESYTAFIKNWKSAREVIKSTCQSDPSFARFLETMAREHKGKLALDSLLIMPVQRIPRYELLIQTLLKHTDVSHPDHSSLLEAQKAVHALAVHINCMERDSLELEQIERLIEGLGHLVAADRSFLRHDLVTVAVSAQSLSRKERALFLFSDLLIITSIKRKSGTTRKIISSSPESITSSFEANKYKLLIRIPLENIEIVKIKDKGLRRLLWEIEHLTKDISTLSQVSNLVSTLHCSHIQLEGTIREMITGLNKQLSDRQTNDSQLSYLELILHTRNGSENVSLAFAKPEDRASWEATLNEAKQRLSLSVEKKSSPEFVMPLQIRKTRAGLQFTCAAPSACQKDVWVCNSDGYIGQVCKLSLYPKPNVSQCVPVYSARILCIASIPANIKSQDENEGNRSSTSASISVEDLDQGGSIHLDSSSSSEGEEEKEKVDAEKKQISSNVSSIDSNCDPEPAMWLGTEDGCILIYTNLESIRNRESSIEIKHGSSVYSIVYFNEKVFVSLANGNIYVYSRDQNNVWNTSEPLSVISIGSAVAPVTRMCPVLDKLWCSAHSYINVLDPTTLKVVNKFSVTGDTNRAITCFVVANLGVWLSLHNSAVMRLIHATTYETLAEVNIAPAVTKMLDSCDDIIRQHKAACLRVTSLLAHKEYLWIGTSAGVLLTMPLPVITPTTTRLNTIPVASGAPHGHTGHVRFLTMVENAPSSNEDRNKSDQSSSRVLVISGGDGYEDFRSTNVAEIAGREDSTNHLLLWRI